MNEPANDQGTPNDATVITDIQQASAEGTGMNTKAMRSAKEVMEAAFYDHSPAQLWLFSLLSLVIKPKKKKAKAAAGDDGSEARAGGGGTNAAKAMQNRRSTSSEEASEEEIAAAKSKKQTRYLLILGLVGAARVVMMFTPGSKPSAPSAPVIRAAAPGEAAAKVGKPGELVTGGVAKRIARPGDMTSGGDGSGEAVPVASPRGYGGGVAH